MPTTNTLLYAATLLFFVFMRENEMIIECCHDSFAKTNIIHVVVVVFIIEQTCDLELFPLALNAASISAGRQISISDKKCKCSSCNPESYS